MSALTFEELVAYFFHAQPEDGVRYERIDFARLINELGLPHANELRHEIVRYLEAGRRLQVIQAELAA